MAKTILLADDSVTIQKVVELTFMDQDYQVVAVSDGQAAIAKLSEMRPDLVIADVHMPEANGYEVCRRAKQTYPGIPVLLLVGTFEPFDQQQADAAGAETHLKKPFDSQDLLRQVDNLVSQAVPPPAPAPVAAPAPPPAPAFVAPAPAFVAPVLATVPPAPVRAEPPRPVAAPQPPMEDLPVGADTVIPMHTPPPAAPPPAIEPIAAVEVTPIEPSVSFEPEPFEEIIPVEPLEPIEPLTPVEPFDMEIETVEPYMPPPAAVFDEPSPEVFELEPVAPAEEAAVPEPVFEYEPAPAAEPEPAPAEAPKAASNGQELSDADVDRIARRLVDLLGDSVLRQVAWEVIPDLAEVVIKERIRELESQVE